MQHNLLPALRSDTARGHYPQQPEAEGPVSHVSRGEDLLTQRCSHQTHACCAPRGGKHGQATATQRVRACSMNLLRTTASTSHGEQDSRRAGLHRSTFVPFTHGHVQTLSSSFFYIIAAWTGIHQCGLSVLSVASDGMARRRRRRASVLSPCRFLTVIHVTITRRRRRTAAGWRGSLAMRRQRTGFAFFFLLGRMERWRERFRNTIMYQ